MKKILCLLILCVFLMPSCAKENSIEYKTDVSTEDISAKMLEETGLETLTKADESWVALNIPIDTTLCDEAVVYISVTGGSDLFGVFKASSQENAEKVLQEAQDYLKQMEENWMSEYLPEDLPKIQNAVTKKCGVYVTFTILDDQIRDSVVQVFADCLKK